MAVDHGTGEAECWCAGGFGDGIAGVVYGVSGDRLREQ